MNNTEFIVFLKGNSNNNLYYPSFIKNNDYERLKSKILHINNKRVTLDKEKINCGKIQFKLKKGNSNWENINCVNVISKWGI